jgi:hypothetical protein
VTGRRNGGSPVTRTGRRMTDPGNAPAKDPATGLAHAVDPRDEIDRAAGREQGESVEINLQGISKFLFPELFATYLYNSGKMFNEHEGTHLILLMIIQCCGSGINIVYPGSWTRIFPIPDTNFFHPRSEFFHPRSRIRIKEFNYFKPKNGF